jgi:hypothetical protein
MQINRKQTYLKYLKAGSVLLMVYFLSVPLVQLFHGHAKNLHVEHVDDHQQVSGSDHCMICDYLSHNQNKQFHLPHPVVPSKVVAGAITLNSHVIAGNYTFTLQGFTNKGPPSTRS